MSGSLYGMTGMGSTGTGIGQGTSATGSSGLSPSILAMLLSGMSGGSGSGMGSAGGTSLSPMSAMMSVPNRNTGMGPVTPNIQTPQAVNLTQGQGNTGIGQGLTSLINALKGTQQGVTPQTTLDPSTLGQSVASMGTSPLAAAGMAQQYPTQQFGQGMNAASYGTNPVGLMSAMQSNPGFLQRLLSALGIGGTTG